MAQNSTAPIAEDGLRHITALYRIDADIRRKGAEARLAARQAHSAPRIEAFETWLTEHRARASAKSPYAKP